MTSNQRVFFLCREHTDLFHGHRSLQDRILTIVIDLACELQAGKRHDWPEGQAADAQAEAEDSGAEAVRRYTIPYGSCFNIAVFSKSMLDRAYRFSWPQPGPMLEIQEDRSSSALRNVKSPYENLREGFLRSDRCRDAGRL